jgi:hypothetical protein
VVFGQVILENFGFSLSIIISSAAHSNSSIYQLLLMVLVFDRFAK